MDALELERRRQESKRYSEYQKRKRVEARELLGNHCSFCSGSDRKLVLHEKSGNGHHGTPAFRLVFKNPEDFVLLCKYCCHSTVHDMMNHLGMSWREIEELIKRKKNGKEKRK